MKILTIGAISSVVHLFSLLISLSSLAAPTLYRTTFFKNSVRRDQQSSEEGRAIAKVIIDGHQCVGFFVANVENRFLIASARHCADYKFEEACAAGKIQVVTENASHKGSCIQTQISSPSTDMVVFEAQFIKPKKVLADISFLKLLNQVPPVGTRLQMLGYPGDDERQRRFTVTENCWIQEQNSVEYSDLTEPEMLNIQNFFKTYAESEETAQARQMIQTWHGAHMNCSVYGGNSGGPILIEGTDLVVGLPTSYLPSIYRLFPESNTTSLETTFSFIEWNLPRVREMQILWGSPPPNF